VIALLHQHVLLQLLVELSADELRQAAFLAGANYKVRAVDITEIDPKRDSKDERTVRLAALLVLEIAAGYKTR
jgi:formiminoglutamase